MKLSRTTLTAAVHGALRLVLLVAVMAATTPTALAYDRPLGGSPPEPDAGRWQTWVLPSPDAVQPPAPPAGGASRAELKPMRATGVSADDLAQIVYWDAGSPSYRWLQIAFDQIKGKPMTNPRVARGISLLNVAIYDAMVAAWKAKYTYNRPRPTVADPTLRPLVAVPFSPSYPSEHAVAAGAAAAILGYLYPDQAQDFAAKAQAAGRSRVLAGVQYRSDVQAGLELGRQVAQQVIARAQADGSGAGWDGTMPAGPGYWTGKNPVEPLAGTWQPWVLSSGSALRPTAPPAYDSPQEAAELQEVQAFTRTWQTNQKALYWQTFDGIFPVWYDFAGKYIFENHLDTNPPRAAAIYAAMSVAQYDAIIACWDAKYTYWAIRPSQLDKTLTTLFPVPNHPGYPSSHSCDAGAIAAALASFFPAHAAFLTTQADEAGESRLWAGIHFRSDITAGLALGRAVADQVIAKVGVMTNP